MTGRAWIPPAPDRDAAARRADRHLADAARRLMRGEDAVAAVEFALILPVMLALYFGATELTRYINTSRKVTLAARTMADLVAREQDQVSTTTLQTIVKAAKAVIQPYDASNATFTFKAIGVYDSAGTQVSVCSGTQASGASDPSTLSPLASTAAPVPPDAYKRQNARYIQVELTMTYTPLLGSSFYNATQLKALTETIPWPVRNGTQYYGDGPEVTLPNGTGVGSPCPATYQG
ncbi:TadE/TadG family type IV pilus assembly protein [Methylobacterium sp. JK268]